MKNRSLEEQAANLEYLEDLYQEYQKQPSSVDSSWVAFFQGVENTTATAFSGEDTTVTELHASQAEKVQRLADAYRRYGHYLAHINPLAEDADLKALDLKTLRLEEYGLQAADLVENFPTFGLLPQPEAPLQDIVKALKGFYCQTAGFDFDHVVNGEAKKWIREEIEVWPLQKTA